MRRTILSWCLYDLANTIFAINMTSYHFPVWAVAEQGASHLSYGVAFGASMLLSALWMPRIGRSSDQSGRRVPGLIFWTLGCVVLTMFLGLLQNLVLILLTFAAANFCYQLAGVYYNALLPRIAPAGRLGQVSGAGVSLGYVGTLIGILAVAPIVTQWGRQAAFIPTGLLFLALALPSFFWIQEKPTEQPAESTAVQPIGQLLRPYWVALFWGLAAVSTIILFMAVYAKEAIGFDDATLHRFLLTCTAAAILGSWCWGRLTDWIGGYRTLWWVWAAWGLALLMAMATFSPIIFWGTGCLAGVALGGTWVASRVLLAEVVGPERMGEAFGWFGLISRFSAALGPVVWGLTLWLAPQGPIRYRLAMGSLLFFVLLGWYLYHRIQAPSGRIISRGNPV